MVVMEVDSVALVCSVLDYSPGQVACLGKVEIGRGQGI
jgi:hypothetical protein